jgi:hypothetical protein
LHLKSADTTDSINRDCGGKQFFITKSGWLTVQGEKRGKTLRLSDLLDVGRPTYAVKPQYGDRGNSNLY